MNEDDFDDLELVQPCEPAKRRDLSGILCRIYVLIDPRDGRVRYVGKTHKTLKQRLAAHLYSPRYNKKGQLKKNYRENWIASLLSQGLNPCIELIESVYGDGCECEVKYPEFREQCRQAMLYARSKRDKK